MCEPVNAYFYGGPLHGKHQMLERPSAVELVVFTGWDDEGNLTFEMVKYDNPFRRHDGVWVYAWSGR